MDQRLRRRAGWADRRARRSRLIVASACTSGASPSTAAPAAGGQHRRRPERCPVGSAAAGTKHVAIVNKDMTDDEIKAAIAAEGSLTVGNWTYTANDELVNQFQKYVKDTYGADVKLNYVGSQQPSEYLTKLAAAKKAGNPAALRRDRGRGELLGTTRPTRTSSTDVLPSDLIPNQSLVLDVFKHAPTVDRVPVDGLPGRRLQQGRRSRLDQVAHGPRRPAAQGQGHVPAAR